MRDLEARAAVGVHWGTFKLTDEPREDPAARMAGLAAPGIASASFIPMQPADIADFS